MAATKFWTHIRTGECKRCKYTGSGVQYYKNGAISDFVCKTCKPDAYTQIAEKEKARWLRGHAKK